MTSPHDAMAAELRQCKAEVGQLQAKLHCMCGSQIDHSAWEGHSPVSMYDYALDRAETELRRVTEERDALLDTICAIGLAIGLPDPRDPAVSDEEGLAAWSGKPSVKVAALRDTADAGRAELAAITAEIPAALLLAHKGDAAAAVRTLVERIGRAHDWFQRIPVVTTGRDDAVRHIIKGCALLRGDPDD